MFHGNVLKSLPGKKNPKQEFSEMPQYTQDSLQYGCGIFFIFHFSITDTPHHDTGILFVVGCGFSTKN